MEGSGNGEWDRSYKRRNAGSIKIWELDKKHKNLATVMKQKLSLRIWSTE